MPRYGDRPAARKAGVLLTTLFTAFVSLAVPATAPAAASFTCDASALRATLLGAQTIEPVTANRGEPACKPATGSLVDTTSLPLPLSAQAVVAKTTVDGAGDTQAILASGGVADLRVSALPSLPLPQQVQDALAQANQAAQGVAPISIPLVGTVDLRPALKALIPNGALPSLDLVRVQTAIAYAGAKCTNGTPETFGDAQVAGLTVGGQQLPVNAVVEQAVSLLDTTTIDFTKLDPSKILVNNPLLPVDSALLTGLLNNAAIKGVLASLPKISIPAAIAQVKVTPGGQTVQDGVLTQRALQVQVSLAGQSIADVVIGEARAGAAGVACDAAVQPSANDLSLQCTKRKLVLIDVLQRGRRVQLLGAADRKYVGRTVSIVFHKTGRVVAHARVAKDGSFQTTAPLPARSLRTSNAARYLARIDNEKSLDLKLARRLVVESVGSGKGQVRIAGHVSRPLAAPTAIITVKRRLSCKQTEVVKRFKPRPDGSFSITLAAPKGQTAAVYRLQTEVRKNVRNPKRFPTFTLPRAINLK
jgi:hypothetical protein